MAVLQMQRICLCALKKDRKQILELLQRKGVVEINDTIAEDSVFQKMDVSVAENIFNKNITSVKNSLEILEKYVPEKKQFLSILNGRHEVDTMIYDTFSGKHDPLIGIANRICKLSKDIAENQAEILKMEIQMEMLSAWTVLDIPLSFKGTKSTSSFIGILPDEWTLNTIYEQLADSMPVNVDIISTSREQTCIFVLCVKSQRESVSESLRAIGFSYPGVSIDKPPTEAISKIIDQIKTAKMDIVKAEEEIASYENSREELRFLQDYETIRTDKYDIISHLLQSNKTFVMTGYIAQVDCTDIEMELNQRYDLALEFEEPSQKDEVPILLQNNGFSNPLEGTVESYSLPGKNEIDPTMVMSLFYYLLFGLMLSDAGYGAIITIGCGIGLIKFKNTIEDSMKKILKMYMFCGIATIFWGIMFGSIFGDLIDVISRTFLGNVIPTIRPIWFFPVNDPMRMLTFSMAIGIIHLFAGLGMKLYQCMKQKDYKSAVYDVLFWVVLLVSSLILLLNMQMVKDIIGVDIAIPALLSNIASIIAVLSAIGITLTNGRESRNPFKRFLKGLFALYGISGYLSDVLSYSRLLALGLATGVIATVVNLMAEMVSGGILGGFLFILIIFLGHTMNLGINALGAYVHTNRLQYVEFFGKFYEGGGRRFTPFAIKTKYYKFKENVKNG
jgi:V/A-type H+/Na+-transporting ATPase subunit I